MVALDTSCREEAWRAEDGQLASLATRPSGASIGSVLVDAEDEKLITLARATRARTGAAEAAAVRDDMGRTSASATVALTSLSLSALQAAVSAAVSSGVQKLEAAAVVTEQTMVADDDSRILAELGAEAPIVADPTGKVRA